MRDIGDVPPRPERPLPGFICEWCQTGSTSQNKTANAHDEFADASVARDAHMSKWLEYVVDHHYWLGELYTARRKKQRALRTAAASVIEELDDCGMTGLADILREAL